MSYETKVQVVREFSLADPLWCPEDDKRLDKPRGVLIEGGPLPGDEVEHRLYGRCTRCTVEAVELRYTLRFPGGGAYRGSLARDLSPAPDPTEALRRKWRSALLEAIHEESRGKMVDGVLDLLARNGVELPPLGDDDD